MVVRRNVVKLAVDRDDWRQARSDIGNRRNLFGELVCVSQASEPLARVVFGVWTIEQIRDVAYPKPVNNRRDFRFRDGCYVPTIVSLDRALAVENRVRR